MSLDPESLTAKDLKSWRKEHFLSQSNLGMLLGVHYTTIARWEHERVKLPGRIILALEAIGQARAAQVRKLRKAKEKLAHEQRLKMIEQGLLDQPKPKKLKPGEQPPKRPTRGNPAWIAAKQARLAREAAEA